MSAKSKQKTLGFGMKPKPLLLKDVLESFRKIAAISGNKSQAVKVQEIKKILVRATGQESKFIIRGLQGKLRIGLARSSVIVALAHAFVLSVPKGVKPMEKYVEGGEYSDNEKVRLNLACLERNNDNQPYNTSLSLLAPPRPRSSSWTSRTLSASALRLP